MTKNPDAQALKPVPNLVVLPVQPASESPDTLSSEVAATSCEGGATSYPPLWRPDEPQFTKAIADYYGTTRKSVQEWALKIREACPWFEESDLKLEDGRHTPLAVGLMGDLRLSGLPFKAWKSKIWEDNAELVQAWQAKQADSRFSQASQSLQSDPTNPSSIVPYQRPGSLQQLLDSRTETQITHRDPSASPVILALQERLDQRKSQNQLTQAQLNNFNQANTDTQAAFETLEELEAVHEGEAAADKLFFLREEAKLRRLEELRLAALGKPQQAPTDASG